MQKCTTGILGQEPEFLRSFLFKEFDVPLASSLHNGLIVIAMFSHTAGISFLMVKNIFFFLKVTICNSSAECKLRLLINLKGLYRYNGSF